MGKRVAGARCGEMPTSELRLVSVYPLNNGRVRAARILAELLRAAGTSAAIHCSEDLVRHRAKKYLLSSDISVHLSEHPVHVN